MSKIIEYPHPVLINETDDFLNSTFNVELISVNDSGENITIGISNYLESTGIKSLIDNSLANIIVRVECKITSYRYIKNLNLNSYTTIDIPKKEISDEIILIPLIIINNNIENYKLEEFNKEYFSELSFCLRKGDIIAKSTRDIKIKLQTIFTKNTASIILVARDNNSDKIKAFFPTNKNDNPDNSDYIKIILPSKDYDKYQKLCQKRHFKAGIKKYIEASLFLPVIVEAIGKLREIEETEEEDKYSGTVWADSIISKLKSLGINLGNSETLSNYEIANLLLDNIISESFDNLIQKMNEWNTIRPAEGDE